MWTKKSSPAVEIDGDLYEYHWYEHHGNWKIPDKEKEGERFMIVRLKKENPDYPDLTPNQLYFVIGIEALGSEVQGSKVSR